MEEPLNLVRLTELLHLERRSRAIVPRRTSLHAEVSAAVARGEIPREDAERALQTVREVIFLRRRKVLLLAADIYSGGQPEAKGLTAEERDLLSRTVALLRDADPFARSAGDEGKKEAGLAAAAEATGAAGKASPTLPDGASEGTQRRPPTAPGPAPNAGGPGSASTRPREPIAEGAAAIVERTADPPVEDAARRPESLPRTPSAADHAGDSAAPQGPQAAGDRGGCCGHVVVRALSDIDFVSLERTYMVRRDDVFSVDPGTAEILVRSGKASAVWKGDAA